MRWVGLGVVVFLLAIAFFALNTPGRVAGVSTSAIAQIAWLLMALLLVSGAAHGFWRFRYDGKRALAGIVFWALAFVAVVLGYQLFN